MNNATESKVCIGRFQFYRPESVLISGRSQRIYRVEIRTVESNPKMPASRLWEDRLSRLKDAERREGVDGPTLRSFELEPGMPAVWYGARSGGSSAGLTLEAMKSFDGHVLQLKREVAANAQSITEDMYRRILAGYVPQGNSGFCVGHGTLVTESSKNEQALLSLTDPKRREFKLSIATETVDTPEPHDALADVEEERKILAEGGSEVTVLRNERRTVAGMVGVEARIRMKPRGSEPFVRFTWRSAGQARNAAAPQIVMIGTAQLPDQAQLEMTWEAVLVSLRPLAPAK